MSELTRRELLVRSAGAAGAAWLGGLLPGLDLLAAGSAEAARESGPLAGGERLGTVPFVGEGSGAMGEVVGSGLTGRLAYDLSRLGPEEPVVSRDEFYVRTLAPAHLPPAEPWSIRTEGLVRGPGEITLASLRERERPLGEHLLECSGNGPHRSFGLLSAARWTGVPVAEVLDAITADRRATRVEIGGFDRHEPPFGSSSPGAGWIFTLDELADAEAFLATGMNGAALPVDHGRPVRLVVPNWFGCCSPKWVDRIRIVDDSAPATSQMREFAGRTHQDGVPELAREYAPARIQVQAMPMRVERWRLPEGDLRYRVLGIVWGGERPVEELVIRFDPAGTDGPPPSDAAGWERVDRVDRRALPTWGFWTHAWVPPGGSGASGRYTVRLQTTARSIPTLRLNLGYYDRTVNIGRL